MGTEGSPKREDSIGSSERDETEPKGASERDHTESERSSERDQKTESKGSPERDETEAERLDRNWIELLQELRVTQTGVQILLAFLLTLPFQPRFVELDPSMVTVYLVAVSLGTLATFMIVAPVTAHRMLFRRHAEGCPGLLGKRARRGGADLPRADRGSGGHPGLRVRDGSAGRLVGGRGGTGRGGVRLAGAAAVDRQAATAGPVLGSAALILIGRVTRPTPAAPKHPGAAMSFQAYLDNIEERDRDSPTCSSSNWLSEQGFRVGVHQGDPDRGSG